MKKEIKIVDKEKNIVQITTTDERWYAIQSLDKKTGNPEYKFIPSVTWICESYPKGIAFFKWLANKGWDEAEALKEAAGDKGSKIHNAITALLEGYPVRMTDKFIDSNGEESELTAEEYEAVLSFVDWFNEIKPEILEHDLTVVNDTYNYAGTIDFVAKIGDKVYIIDFKTSQTIWPSYELQVSAYKHAYQSPVDGLAILQIGYHRNQKLWKFTEIEDKFDLFLATQKIWANEHSNEQPSQKDYPLEVSLLLNEEKEKTNKMVKIKSKYEKGQKK